MPDGWVPARLAPPLRCSECGRIYPDGSGRVDGKVEVYTNGDDVLCIVCAVHKGVTPRAVRR